MSIDLVMLSNLLIFCCSLFSLQTCPASGSFPMSWLLKCIYKYVLCSKETRREKDIDYKPNTVHPLRVDNGSWDFVKGNELDISWHEMKKVVCSHCFLNNNMSVSLFKQDLVSNPQNIYLSPTVCKVRCNEMFNIHLMKLTCPMVALIFN